MIKAGQMGIGLVLSAWSLIAPQGASAQFAPPPPPSQNAAMLGIGNPYMNPALNPYLNPAITQQPMNGGNALLYLYAANTARGGIGSGQLSNPPSSSRARARAAELPDSVGRPGGGAAKYFNPGPVNVNGAGRYYNQRGRYFNNNGR